MRKPSTCWCPGRWQDKILRWGCLLRGERSRLYCKDCRHEWWSKRNYVAKIADWKKDTRSGMTDQGILDRILAGTLRVREESGRVIVESDSHVGTVVLKQIERAVHRLNWMFHENGRGDVRPGSAGV